MLQTGQYSKYEINFSVSERLQILGLMIKYCWILLHATFCISSTALRLVSRPKHESLIYNILQREGQKYLYIINSHFISLTVKSMIWKQSSMLFEDIDKDRISSIDAHKNLFNWFSDTSYKFNHVGSNLIISIT